MNSDFERDFQKNSEIVSYLEKDSVSYLDYPSLMDSGKDYYSNSGIDLESSKNLGTGSGYLSLKEIGMENHSGYCSKKQKVSSNLRD